MPSPDLRAKETESYRGEVAGPGPQGQEAQTPACGLGRLQGAGRLSKALPALPAPLFPVSLLRVSTPGRLLPPNAYWLLLAAPASGESPPSSASAARPLAPSALQGRRRAPAACGDSPNLSPVICHRFPLRQRDRDSGLGQEAGCWGQPLAWGLQLSEQDLGHGKVTEEGQWSRDQV